jgi:hypothetical protein
MSAPKPPEDIIAGWDSFKRPKDGEHFRHYKGGEYVILATGFIESSEEPCVVYRSLEKDITWVRTASDFFEEIHFGGLKQPRFQKILT